MGKFWLLQISAVCSCEQGFYYSFRSIEKYKWFRNILVYLFDIDKARQSFHHSAEYWISVCYFIVSSSPTLNLDSGSKFC